jgi:hypothetical protein
MPGKQDQNADEPVGLEWAAEADDASPVMREIARLALQRSLSLGKLAIRLNALDGRGRSTKVVSAHFRAKTPRPETVGLYAEVFGLSATHVALLRDELLSIEDAKEVLVGGAVRYLLSKSARFKRSTAEKVRSIVDSMLTDEPETARRIASRIQLAGYREALGLPDESVMKHPSFAERFGFRLTAFADALKPMVNLFEASDRRDRRLARIWIHLGFLFSDERDSKQVIALIVRLLHKRGFRTTNMEATLREVQTTLPEALAIPTRFPSWSRSRRASQRPSRGRMDRGSQRPARR